MVNDSGLFEELDKCPFSSGQALTAVNGSLSSTTENDEHNKLLWAPQINPIQLRNYQTNTTIEVAGPLSDNYVDCRHHVCTSTLMALPAHGQQKQSSSKNMIDEVEAKSVSYIRKEVYDYMAIYHEDKKTSETDYKKRLEEIEFELQQTGTYTQTFDELEYGCQLSWRNAARCINRLFWRTLKVIDCRQVTTNDEMFAQICQHIRLAYNNGTLQATTLVLHPRARLWSTQYFRYACYEQLDGSLLGDPANRELTIVAMKLGWTKPENERTPWDLLPIIVQADSSLPASWYELTDDLKLEIFLSHPDTHYDAAIKKLELRWVAQPFVADKAIEIGGIVYRCVPFSGWFMQTEVGRNLCDIQRYNMIPKLAALLNLDVTTAANSQLNVDRIYVEVNAAVLHSFEKAKVGIVDHHTAAAGFMKFMKQEVVQRGNVPADWIWIVPPISGGMSSVFHQEMFNYILKPRILDQRDPWVHYTPFIRQEESLRMTSAKRVRYRWALLRAACTIIGFALTAMKQRISIHVLYASASGTAQTYAEQMSKRLLIIGYNAKLMELDAYPFQETITSRSIVFIITSTFGQGNAPEGGQKVEEWLRKENDANVNDSHHRTRQSFSISDEASSPVDAFPLHWCSYAVCAIGSSAYPFFCEFGKLVDRTFQALGAQRLAPLATCDALNQQYKNYNEWEEETIIALKKTYPHACSREINVDPPPKERSMSFTVFNQAKYLEQQVTLSTSTRPTFIPLTFDEDAATSLAPVQVGPFTKENPFHAIVLQNIELTGAQNIINGSFSQQRAQPKASNGLEYESRRQRQKVTIPSTFINVNNDECRSVRLLVFDTTGLTYHAGDHVCILPENTMANVNGVILACGWQLENKLLNKPCSLAAYTHGKHHTLRQILTHYVDLTTPLRPHTLNTLATYASDPHQQRQILELGKGAQRYTDWLVNAPTVKETLQEFPSIQAPLEELIQLLPQLQPRYYSISSSNRLHPNQLHITVSVVTYTTARSILRKGVCSNYLQQTLPKLSDNGQCIRTTWKRAPSAVRMFISPNPHFRLPGQDSLPSNILPLRCPLLMFAIGSGIAPFRSFWQELQMLEQPQENVTVERVLFMGCRTAGDFLYAKELHELTNQTNTKHKLFTAVIPVYSRENHDAKRYIQDAMLDYESLICSLLVEENAFIYMCGSTRSCQGIESALASILQSGSEYDLTVMQANHLIKEYKKQGRIKQDMFG